MQSDTPHSAEYALYDAGRPCYQTHTLTWTLQTRQKFFIALLFSNTTENTSRKGGKPSQTSFAFILFSVFFACSSSTLTFTLCIPHHPSHRSKRHWQLLNELAYASSVCHILYTAPQYTVPQWVQAPHMIQRWYIYMVLSKEKKKKRRKRRVVVPSKVSLA